ncbi:MAG: hypothetical protein Q8R76_06115 [Candidatus Omnitrophota bacterium]|nr:hypothetical protein [Candidatus Omnitrophota bacterium]
MAAGAAYLAKAYALPFFLIHFPVTIFIRRLTSGRNSRFPLGKMVKTLCFGMMGFSLLAAPWIGVMSVKYSTLTISAAGHKPEPYAIHSWEAPSDLAYKHWSPFQSFENFKHQFKVCLKNAAAIALYFGILGGPVLVLLPFLVLTGASFIVCRGSDERLSPLREMYTKVYTLGII